MTDQTESSITTSQPANSRSLRRFAARRSSSVVGTVVDPAAAESLTVPPPRETEPHLGASSERSKFPEFVRSYDTDVHRTINAIAAAITNAQAGLNWLRAQPLDLEEVRQALDNIASDGKRAYEMVIRLRHAMMMVTADGAPCKVCRS